jgi:hypothetical protein
MGFFFRVLPCTASTAIRFADFLPIRDLSQLCQSGLDRLIDLDCGVLLHPL